jgi:two-component system, OmpR family, phosphate regulon sensor histidine kinase PhoR
MKLNRTYLFIGVSSVALLIVLIIQVNWILETARINEALFNEKAKLVLARTASALADKDARRITTVGIGRNEVRKIDSLLRHYMALYNFHIDYYFEVKPGSVTTVDVTIPTSNMNNLSCKTSLDEVAGQEGMELKLVFPDKQQFILAEMGTMFITSVILIVVVLVMFWRTILSLMKEKMISEHTTDFLNNMTHEFKTPLTNIALAGKMMVKDSTIKQEDKIKHYSGIILEENEKLRQQVEQVLSMTALERGEIPLLKTELNFHQLIQDCLKSISIQIESKQGILKLNLGAYKYTIMGDKAHLTNALYNLIDNAIKYSGENPELNIQTTNDHKFLIVIISDNGIGIDEQHQKRVFDKFFRVPTGDVHNVKGFGLGLSYVKKIIELHGGTIDLQSEKGKGSIFTFTLPYV